MKLGENFWKAMTAAALAVSFVGPAPAGDASEINVLGFSPDGKIFAFEEFGVQDGSGFPFANRFYIDTATDEFRIGSPIRVRIDKDGASVAEARTEAARRGSSIVADRTLGENRGYLAAWNALTELSSSTDFIAFRPRPVFPPIDDPYALRLDVFASGDDAPCHGLGQQKGFRLTLARLGGNGASRVLHEDKSVPSSRNCPTGYRVAGVQTFFPDGGRPVFAAILAVESIGFEGPDHRWMAVTGRLD